jgi:enoyl-CoA hydratase
MDESEMFEPPPVLSERRGAVQWITLNRPRRLNAVTLELYQMLERELLAAGSDPTLRAIVLTGNGRAFSVGADLKNHAGTDPASPERREYIWSSQRTCRALLECPKPVVAAVNGYAIGGGAELAISCDFVVMSEQATLRFPEITIGTYVGGAASARLATLVGVPKTKELLLLGRALSGVEAESWGLAYRCVPDERLNEEVDELTNQLASAAPISMAFAKAHLNHLDGSVLNREADAMLSCMRTSDWLEGVNAFAEKRTPKFEGR